MPCRSSASATATAKSCCEGRGAKPGICVASTPPSARAARLRCARVPLSPDSMSEAVDAGDRALVDALLRGRRAGGVAFQQRSEEHTSELQSLMRISYAVFCLKKKTHQTHTATNS